MQGVGVEGIVQTHLLQGLLVGNLHGQGGQPHVGVYRLPVVLLGNAQNVQCVYRRGGVADIVEGVFIGVGNLHPAVNLLGSGLRFQTVLIVKPAGKFVQLLHGQLVILGGGVGQLLEFIL